MGRRDIARSHEDWEPNARTFAEIAQRKSDLTRARVELDMAALFAEMKIHKVISVYEEGMLDTDHLIDLARASADGDPAKQAKNVAFIDTAIREVHEIAHEFAREMRS
jgi:hypothetical protein